jgi:hypothetical protein
VPSECPEAEAGEIGASGEEDEVDVCSVQRPARVAQVSGDEDTRPQREKTERESTEEPPRIRTVVDTTPRRLGPVHADQGTDCDRFDQETLAIGTGLAAAIAESAHAGTPKINALPVQGLQARRSIRRPQDA